MPGTLSDDRFLMTKLQIALQLYTVRDQLAHDFAGTLRKVADIGYRAVETAFWPEGMAVQQAAELIHQAGLTIMAAHVELPLGDQQRPVLDSMAALGCTRAVWHGWPQDPDYSSLAGIHRLAERYNQANEVCRRHGLSFGLHNHWWEHEPVEGHYPHDLLLAEIDSTIFFELDTYWARTAGRDPVHLVAQLGDRAPLLHFKDGPAVKGEPKQAVGDGVLDFPAILQASAGNAEWVIVELDDCATDMLAAIERSFHYLSKLG
jgi:sugar phosphate isomerase/epimerase